VETIMKVQRPSVGERLANFPVAFFAMVMGLAGVTIAWEKAQHLIGLDLAVNGPLVTLTLAVFASLFGVYLLKVLRHRDAVVAELAHPVKLNFFPTISISFLLLAIAFLPLDPEISRPLWIFGATLHLLFTLYVINVPNHCINLVHPTLTRRVSRCRDNSTTRISRQGWRSW
jgi:tellurite resistance protein